MPFALPYDFDTGRETRRLLKGVIALLAVMLAGGLVMLLVRHDAVGAAGTVLIDAMLVGVGVILVRVQPGACGRMTREAVETNTQRVWGLALPGPVGRIRVADF
jgi:chromate transport protein ChrA